MTETVRKLGPLKLEVAAKVHAEPAASEGVNA